MYIHAPNAKALKYIRQILTDIKEEIDNNIIVIRNFNTPLMSMDISPRQKIIRQQRSEMTQQTSWTYLVPTGHYIPPKGKYILFPSSYRTFSSRDYILGHNTSLNTFTRIKLSFSNYHRE